VCSYPRAVAIELRILIADDNSDAAGALAELLTDHGHTVLIATDGQSAAELASDFHPQVGVLDIHMPRMDGHELARHIRRQPWGREMLLVALSSWEHRRDRGLAREAGFDYQIAKPADLERLMELFATVEA
jgi:CheY-like chemotaxis protein